MRLFVAVGILASLVCGSAFAQSCETINIRNASGEITSTSRICVDGAGKWVDPETVGVKAEALPETQSVMAAPTTLSIPERADLSLAEPIAVEATVTDPVVTDAVVAPVIVPPVSVTTSLPPVVPADAGWRPTSGASKRSALYAKLGLVCKARKAVFCGDVACTGLCAGKTGWCDGKTGEVHASLESIERLYCRKKKRR